MFSPNGFIPLTALVRLISKEMESRLYEKAKTCHKGIIKKIDDSGGKEASIDTLFRGTTADIYEFYVFIIVKDMACLSSPLGKTIKIDLEAMLRAMLYNQVTIHGFTGEKDMRTGVGDIPEYFYPAYKLVQCSIDEFTKGYDACFQGFSYENLVEFSEMTLVAYSYQSIPAFFERVGYTISLEGYNFIRQYDFDEASELLPMANILRHFNGWSICVPDDFSAKKLNERILKFVTDKNSDQSLLTSFGRPPRKRLKAFQAYSALYPDGHLNETWPEVSKKITAHAGEYISPDTIRRAIGGAKLLQNEP